MDPNNQNLQKLEEDLQGLSQEAQQGMPTLAPQPAISQPPAMHEIPRPKSKTLPLFITLLLLISFGSLGLWAYQNYFAQKGELSGSYNAVTPVATTDPTTNWQTYTDKSGRFSFKYPTNLIEFDGGVSGPINGNPKDLASFADKTTVLEGTHTPFDGFSIYASSLGGKTFEEYIEKEKADREERDIEIWNATGQTIQSSFQSWVLLNGPAFPEIAVYYLQFPNGKDAVSFARGKQSESFPKVFEQILSTFTFLESTPSSSPRSTPSARPL